jgi:hypothetical protein
MDPLAEKVRTAVALAEEGTFEGLNKSLLLTGAVGDSDARV